MAFYLLSKYLWSVHGPGTVLVSGNTVVNKLIMVPASKELIVGLGEGGGKTDNKQAHTKL